MPAHEQDVRVLPAYGVAEAAHYLLVPRATLRSWVAGMSYGRDSVRKFFKPVIHPAAKSPVALSFINLIEAHVLAAIRRQHRVDMPAVRRAINFLEKEFGSAHPLADYKFETNGIDLFIQHYGQFISVSQGGQIAVRDLLKAHLKRIERDERGIPLDRALEAVSLEFARDVRDCDALRLRPRDARSVVGWNRRKYRHRR